MSSDAFDLALVQYADEERLVWLEDAGPLPYVRESALWTPFRARRPRVSLPGVLVGYVELNPKAKSTRSRFHRRFWWRRTYPVGDPYTPTYLPAEGVRPGDVVAGRPTPRGVARRVEAVAS